MVLDMVVFVLPIPILWAIKRLLGTYGSKSRSRRRSAYHQSVGDSYGLQSRGGNLGNFKTAVSANTDEVLETGSQEHIVENGERIGYATTVSVHSSSTTAVDGGATFHTR
ncbi:hypothetical protein ACEPPN_000290 [Leptodophora sp. 'Broadleaf-Isolate-01']